MQHSPARAPKPHKASRSVAAESQPAISARDSAALSWALDENAPPDGVQEAVLRRVLKAIDADNSRLPTHRTSKS
jgi:hypothetical protein